MIGPIIIVNYDFVQILLLFSFVKVISMNVCLEIHPIDIQTFSPKQWINQQPNP